MIALLATGMLLALAPAECRKCDGEGVLPCKRCERSACPEGAAARFCSVRLRCVDCEGAGTVDCPKCDVAAETDPAELARAAAARTWRSEVDGIDEFMEKDLVHGESAHFRVTFDVPKYDAEAVRPKQRCHDGMHLTLERLESLYARFCEQLAATDADFFGRTHVLIWSREADQRRGSLRYTGQESSTQSKLMGAQPFVSIHYDKSHLHEEAELHQAIVHQTVHCLLSNVFDGVWPGNVGGGWLDAGLAHLYEVEMFDGVRHYCYVESDTMRRFRFGRWESTVRQAVDRDEAPSLLELFGKQTAELTPEQHMFSWSLCDFVVRAHGPAFPVIVRGVKDRRPLKDVLREALDLSPFELDARWADFVREHYSPKPSRR